MRLLIAFAMLLLLAPPHPARAGAVAIAAGDYGGGLLIGFDPATHTVTGYYSSETGGGQFSCIFYLSGKLNGPTAPITSYFPPTSADDVIKGELTPLPAASLRVTLSDDHGGCWNVQHFADPDHPAEFTLETAHPWTWIAVMKAGKVYFFDTPASATHRKGYLVKGDGVGVRGVQPGWLLVDYVGGEKPVSGWIRASDVYTAGE